MNRTFFKSTALAIVMSVCCISAQAQKSFGYLSYSQVLHSMNDYTEVQQKIGQMRDEYSKEQDRAEQNFSRQYAEFIDGQKTFSENIMLKRQKELQQLMEQGIQFKQEARKLLKDAEKELMQPLYTKLNEAIAKVGTEKQFDYVLNTDDNAYPFINSEKGEDITEAVKGLLVK